MLLIWSSVITQISQLYEELRIYFAISFYPPHLEKSWKFLHLLDFHYSREVHSHVRPFSHKLSIFISALVLSTMPVNLLSPCQCLSAPGLLCVFDLLASAPYSFSSPNSCPPNKEPNIANPFPSILTFEQYRFSWNIVIFFYRFCIIICWWTCILHFQSQLEKSVYFDHWIARKCHTVITTAIHHRSDRPKLDILETPSVCIDTVCKFLEIPFCCIQFFVGALRVINEVFFCHFEFLDAEHVHFTSDVQERHKKPSRNISKYSCFQWFPLSAHS